MRFKGLEASKLPSESYSFKDVSFATTSATARPHASTVNCTTWRKAVHSPQTPKLGVPPATGCMFGVPQDSLDSSHRQQSRTAPMGHA